MTEQDIVDMQKGQTPVAWQEYTTEGEYLGVTDDPISNWVLVPLVVAPPHDDVVMLQAQIHSLEAMLADAIQPHVDNASELDKWEAVFGHLGSADEAGNEWHKLCDENDSLKQQLAEITAREAGLRELVAQINYVEPSWLVRPLVDAISGK